MENLMTFIPEDLLILVVAIYILGIFFKKLESVKDKYITSILMVFAIVFSMIISSPSANSFLQGIIVWGIAIGCNQTIKQLKKDE